MRATLTALPTQAFRKPGHHPTGKAVEESTPGPGAASPLRERASVEIPLFLRHGLAGSTGPATPGVRDFAPAADLPQAPSLAREGVENATGGLPFGDTLQRAFGPHDLTDIRSQVGGPAATAARALRARAFATGGAVAFGETPTLRTAAHEAAHVIQQRAGATRTLPSESSQAALETEADAVAEAVTSGRSAAPLMAKYSPASRVHSDAVQRQPTAADDRSEEYRAGRPSRGAGPPGATPAGAGPPNLGSCQLRAGTLSWTLAPRVGYVNARIVFVPNSTVAAASRTISFIQTVAERTTSGGFLGIGSTTWASRTQVDTLPRDRDPYYGAAWDGSTGQWSDEPNSTQFQPPSTRGSGATPEGSSPFRAGGNSSAILNDSPFLDMNQTKEFETAIVVVETGEVLGHLRWNVQRWSAVSWFGGPDSSTTVRRANCAEGSSAEFQSVVDQYVADQLLSDGGEQTVVTGFAAGSAVLPPAPIINLTPVIRTLQDHPERRVTLGGGATQDEPNPVALSQQRAEAVRGYLVRLGIDASRISVESYGADWALTPTDRANAGDTNRRVQVWVRQP